MELLRTTKGGAGAAVAVDRGIGDGDNQEDDFIKKAQAKTKYIKSNFNYDILFNLHYQHKFQFQPLDERNEEQDNIMSDIVAEMLNMNTRMSKPVNGLGSNVLSQLMGQNGKFDFNAIKLKKKTITKSLQKKLR